MKLQNAFRNVELAKGLITRIKQSSLEHARLMEFCGSHTMQICRYGLRQILPKNVKMVSGPGCPVCVTANADLNKAIAIARQQHVILTTFGDMMKVPSGDSSLQLEKSRGADIRIVYSALDALDIAQKNPDKIVVFLGIGFETTAPTVAASILEASSRNLKNYRVLSLHKVCPPVIKALLDMGEIKLDGLICPGHVSTITGAKIWNFIAREYGIPCVVAGFEPLDILQAIAMLIDQIENQTAKVEIAYKRCVSQEGNLRAIGLMNQVFEPAVAFWRGIGPVSNSGLKIREEYAEFDAEGTFNIEITSAEEHPGCSCGDILRGIKNPEECSLFGKICTPLSPVGPCMVSSEGTCAAYYRYGGKIGG